MAHCDTATADFFSKLSEDKAPEEKHPVVDALRTVRRAVRGSNNPEKALVRTVTGLVAGEVFNKEGGVNPLQIFYLLNEKYERLWWDWEPETLWTMLTRDHGVDPVRELKDLVMSLQTLVKTSYPFEHWHIFEKVGHALNLNHVDFMILQPLELDEVAWALKVMRTIQPKAVLDTEVCGYIAAAARNSGVVLLPNDMFGDECQSELDDLNNDMDLKAKVEALWPTDEFKGHGTAIGVQILRLKEIQSFVADKMVGV